jgi:hypothetical protein
MHAVTGLWRMHEISWLWRMHAISGLWRINEISAWAVWAVENACNVCGACMSFPGCGECMQSLWSMHELSGLWRRACNAWGVENEWSVGSVENARWLVEHGKGAGRRCAGENNPWSPGSNTCALGR